MQSAIEHCKLFGPGLLIFHARNDLTKGHGAIEPRHDLVTAVQVKTLRGCALRMGDALGESSLIGFE